MGGGTKARFSDLYFWKQHLVWSEYGIIKITSLQDVFTGSIVLSVLYTSTSNDIAGANRHRFYIASTSCSAVFRPEAHPRKLLNAVIPT